MHLDGDVQHVLGAELVLAGAGAQAPGGQVRDLQQVRDVLQLLQFLNFLLQTVVLGVLGGGESGWEVVSVGGGAGRGAGRGDGPPGNQRGGRRCTSSWFNGPAIFITLRVNGAVVGLHRGAEGGGAGGHSHQQGGARPPLHLAGLGR